MAATHSGDQEYGFLDTPLARLIGLAVAISMGWVIWSTWSDDIANLFSPDRPGLPIVEAPALPATDNPALAACLERRIGDVDQMLADGLITEPQSISFKTRAEDLCRAQNPAN